MYFAVTKLCFDLDTSTPHDSKALSSLCEKLRKKFKASVAPCPIKDGDASVAIALLHRTEQQISNTLDDIAEFCENSGIGRVKEEHTLIDSIDSISDFEEDEEGGDIGGHYQ